MIPLDALVGALLGSIGTGLVGLGLQKRKERLRQDALVSSLLAELRAMYGFKIVDQHDEGVPAPGAFPTTIYEENAGEIGSLEHSEQVIDFYTKLKSEKDYIRLVRAEEDGGWEEVRGNLENRTEEWKALIDLLSD